MKNIIIKVFRFTVVWFFIMAPTFHASFAQGLKISPGAFCLQNADIGKDLDLGIDLIITNDSADEQTYIIRPLLPSQARTSWMKGYNEIPDTSWFYLLDNKISIPAHSEGKLRMHLNIPDRECYYNQHWMVYVEITTEADKGQMFRVGLKPNYMIETKAKEDIKEKPYGILGIIPSTVKAQDVITGKRKKVNFKIYNNDNVTHTYLINPYIPKTTSAKQDISGTPGYEWIKETSWIKPAISWFKPSTRVIEIKPGKVKKITLSIDVPKGSSCIDEGWESIVFVEPDQGLSGFVRILVEPKE